MQYKVKKLEIIKLLISIVFTIFSGILYLTHNYKALALFALIVNIGLLIYSSRDMILYLITIVIFYSNYSIIIGEYLVGNLQLQFTGLRSNHYDLFELGLFLLCLFSIWIAYFLKPVKKEFNFPFCKNKIIFWTIYIIIILINLIFFDRSSVDGYIVRSQPIAGYSYLMFIAMNYYSGNNKNLRLFSMLLFILLALQSLMFGNRHSIIALAIVQLVSFYINKVSVKVINLIIVISILFLSIIGVMRTGNSLSINNIILQFFSSLAVQDTSVYAFSASITHLYLLDFDYNRIMLFFGFVSSLIFGGSLSITKNTLLTEIAKEHAFNLGGGLIFSYFYVWFGYVGVLFLTLLIGKIYDFLRMSRSDLWKLVLVAAVALTSHWYVYSPLHLFRGPFIILPVLLFFLRIIDKYIKGIKGV